LLEPDDDQLLFDAGAKSVAFFCVKRPVRIDADVIADLRTLAAENNGRNARICLHAGPEANHHDMVVLEHRGKYYRPHKHADKGEAFHVMDGQLGIFAFADDGAIVDAHVLNPGDIYRVEAGMYHAVLPQTEQVLYHENKPGPFLGDGDSIYADWAPDGTDQKAVDEYVDLLNTRLTKN
jgi:glucose-6-phosphate isomerase